MRPETTKSFRVCQAEECLISLLDLKPKTAANHLSAHTWGFERVCVGVCVCVGITEAAIADRATDQCNGHSQCGRLDACAFQAAAILISEIFFNTAKTAWMEHCGYENWWVKFRVCTAGIHTYVSSMTAQQPSNVAAHPLPQPGIRKSRAGSNRFGWPAASAGGCWESVQLRARERESEKRERQWEWEWE